MLVLARKIEEQILFPGLDIKITVLSLNGNRVQLGIEAPPHIDITRPDAIRPATKQSKMTIEVDAGTPELSMAW